VSRRKTKEMHQKVEADLEACPACIGRLWERVPGALGRHPERLAYSVDELVEVIGVSRGFLFNLIDDGRLVARKLDGRTLILKSDLVRFLESLPVRPPKTKANCASASN
jgi:excisionase family DNA binding protein